MELDIKNCAGITLITENDFYDIKNIIPKSDAWWWTCCAADGDNRVMYVLDDELYTDGYFCDREAGVRPVVELKHDIDAAYGGIVGVGNFTATYIGEKRVLLDENVCKHIFDSRSNKWKGSELKKFIESAQFKKMLFERELI